MKRSADRGVFYAIAAGNSSTDACWTSPQRVGTYPGVVTVGATDATDSEAAFSSFGRCVDLWAPGVDILTDNLGGGVTTTSGTSYSAPYVAGAAGLFLSTKIDASAASVETALKSDAVATGTRSKDGTPLKLVYAGHY